MKQLPLTIVLLICTCNLFAQIEIGTTWYYCQSSFLPPHLGGHPDSIRTIKAIKDTLVDNTTYLKLEGSCACGNLDPGEDFYLIREEERRIYYYFDGEEHLLYDFNLNTGEVLRIYWPFISGGGYADSLRLRVDSTGTWPLEGVGMPTAKVQYLSPLEGFDYYADWGNRFIEGIGGSYYECFVPQWGLCEIPTQPLLLYEGGNGTSYDFGYDCISDAAKESYQENTFSIFPNPFSDLLNIDIHHLKVEAISVSNIMGQELRTISSNQGQLLQLDLTNEAAGIYIVKAMDRRGEILGVRKVVKKK